MHLTVAVACMYREGTGTPGPDCQGGSKKTPETPVSHRVTLCMVLCRFLIADLLALLQAEVISHVLLREVESFAGDEGKKTSNPAGLFDATWFRKLLLYCLQPNLAADGSPRNVCRSTPGKMRVLAVLALIAFIAGSYAQGNFERTPNLVHARVLSAWQWCTCARLPKRSLSSVRDHHAAPAALAQRCHANYRIIVPECCCGL